MRRRAGDAVVILALLSAWLLILIDVCRGRRPADFLSMLMLFVFPMLLFRIVPRTIEVWKKNKSA